MSKPEIPGAPIPALPPDEQIQIFADLFRGAINPATHARLAARARELGLPFADAELAIIAALDTPARVQDFLNTQIYYNDDHALPDQEETALPPRGVLQTARAHCFEGATFAYAVNWLHGHNPRMALLEASQDSDHNLVLFQDQRTGRLGCNAHSAFPHLDGRAAEFRTLRALAESYQPWYYSDRTRDPNDLTLVGYSDPFDLTAKYGAAWIASEEPLWEIYHTYIDDALTFRYLFDDSDATHLYPTINALRNDWIEIDAQGKARVNADNLPRAAQELWRAFWRAHPSTDRKARPRGAAREIEKQFMRLTGTTPLDLDEMLADLEKFLSSGYRIEQLMRQK
jgi:hypothetical protein